MARGGTRIKDVDAVFLAVRCLSEAMDRFDQAASSDLSIHRSDLRADRRTVDVELTPQTFAAFARVYRPCGEAVRSALAEFDARHLTNAADVLNHVTAAVTDQTDQRTP